jgi:hypothetical protein
MSGQHKSLVAFTVLWFLFGVGHRFCSGQSVETAQPRLSAYAQAYLEEGKGEMQRGSYLRAIRLFSAAIQNGADAYKLRGQAYLWTGDRDKALADITRYLSAQPSDPAAYLLRGDVAAANGHPAAALKDYRKAVKLAPSSAEAYVSRGLGYVALERYYSAVRDFETALRIDPRNLDALSNLGVVNMLANRPNEARECFNKALRLETNSRWQEILSAWLSRLPQETDAAPDPDIPPEDDFPDGEIAETEKDGTTDSTEENDSAKRALRSIGPPSCQGAGSTRHSHAAPGRKWTHLSGKWETTYMGARITMDLSHAGGNLSGIMNIRNAFGKNDTYHFEGTLGHEGTIRATHHSGHLFEGRIADNGHIAGVLTTKLGRTIPVDFSPNYTGSINTDAHAP